MNLTDKEKKMIENLIRNDYSDSGLESTPWVFALQECGVNDFGLNEYKGILGSLVKKGLVEIIDSEEKGRSNDFYCYLTEKGKEVTKELFSKKYDWL